MNLLKLLIFWTLLLSLVLVSCKEYNSLDSILISPTSSDPSDDTDADIYICRTTASGGLGYRQFKVIGEYDDDDTEDLSDEVTWSTDKDASDDTNLFDLVPGFVQCNDAYGLIGVKATYTIESGVSSEGEEGSSSDISDSVIVNAQ